MVSQSMGVLFSGVSVIFGVSDVSSQSVVGLDPVAVRVGVTLLILLVALLLGPRIARSAARVPALIESARERRAARQEAENGGEDADGAKEEIEETSEHPTVTSRWVGGVVLFCIWVLALYLIVVTWFAQTTLGSPDPKALRTAFQQFLLNLGLSMLIIIVTLVVARALQQSLVASLRRGRVNGNLVVLAGRAIFTVTLIVGGIAILSVWGLGIALPVTLIGAVTVALSFALQDILKNLVSGIYLLLERPFVIGDQITIPPYTGVVEDISIRVTALRTSGGERVLVPNGMLFSTAVTNNSFYQRRRLGLLITLPDNGPDAIKTAQQQILQTLTGLDFALRAPAPDVTLVKASGGKVDLRGVFWLSATRSGESRDRLAQAMEQIRGQLPDAEVTPLDPTLAD